MRSPRGVAVSPMRSPATGSQRSARPAAIRARSRSTRRWAEQEIEGLQEVAGPDLVGVVPEKRRPALTRRARFENPPHVFLDCALRHADLQLEQLAANALCSPESILRGHLLDGAIVSAAIRGWAPARLERRSQRSRNPCRCHRTIVSGWTSRTACLQVDTIRASQTRIARSKRLSLGRLICLQATSSCLRKRAFSRSSSPRDRK